MYKDVRIFTHARISEIILHLAIIYENKAIIYGSIIICYLLLQVFLPAFTVSSQFILTPQLKCKELYKPTKPPLSYIL